MANRSGSGNHRMHRRAVGRASDPWLSFSPDGTLHQMSLVFQTDPPPGSERGFGSNGMAVSKSEDGGLTWSDPILIAEDDNPRFLNDKNSITADPYDPNLVYAVWDLLNISPGGIKINQRGRGGLGSFKGAAVFTRSTDGGDTWEPVKKLYDPDGGFVTGGGWIDSPEGAYMPDPSLTGKANFGFVSKYKKGASIPTGNTEFQFHAANLNFHSSSYEWLVVTGSDYARYKGTGTINGQGNFKFMLWAGDKDPDTFRIKIWTENEESAEETVIYDNGFEGSGYETGQPIDGGSIVIHKKK